MKTVLTLVVTGCLAIALAAAQSRSAADQFQEALRLEEVKGDLRSAIEQYKKLVQGSDRAIAAKALVQMAGCYEKLGHGDARGAYERVAREFADQAESVATARSRLAALTRVTDGRTLSGMVPRLVWGDASSGQGGAAIAPDGRHLVFVGGRENGLDRVSALYVRDLLAGLNRPLTRVDRTGDIVSPVFSPDGKLVVYSWYDGVRDARRLIALDGSEAPRFPVPYRSDEWPHFAPVDWSLDGKQILAIATPTLLDRPTHIVLVSVADGSIRALKTFASQYFPSRMSLSRDGRYLVYDHPARGDSGERDIFILGTQGGQEARLVSRGVDDRSPTFTPDGSGVLFLTTRAGSDQAWFLRVVDGKPLGSPQLLGQNMGENPRPIGFTPNGSFYYYSGESATKVFAATIDPTNGTMAVQADTVTQRVVTFGPAWSPDGRYLAYGSQRPSRGEPGATIIVIRSLATGEETERAPELGSFRIRTSGWSPDGRSFLAGGTDTSGRRGLYRVDARTGRVTPLLDEIPSHFTWFLNGTALVFIRGDAIVSHDLETGGETEVYRPSGPLELGSCVEVSRDGQRLAFYIEDPVTRSMSVMVVTAPGETPRELGPSVKYPERIDDILALTPDGRHVLYTTYDQEAAAPQVHKVWRVAVDGGAPQEIRLPMERLGYVGTVSVHPDGQRIAFAGENSATAVWVVENFLPKTGVGR